MTHNLDNIEAIIFDLGGVIINIDPMLTHKAFDRLGISQVDKQFTFTHQEQVYKDFEVGKISIAEFRDSFRKFIDRPVDDGAIDNAWNAMLLDIPPHRIDVLKDLNNRYKSYLLSNTNVIHTDSINAYLKKEHGMDNLNPLFNTCYFSQEIGYRKPNAEAFNYVLENNNLSPKNTLFLDDNKDNVDAAKALGINTILVHQDMASYFS